MLALMEDPEWVRVRFARVCVTASSAPCPLNSDVVVSIVALNQSLILSLVKCAVNKQRKSSGVSLFLPGLRRGSCPLRWVSW